MSAALPDIPASRLRLRPLSALVMLVVAVLAVSTYAFTRHVVSDQEHRLLTQRTDEAGLYVSSLITSSVQSEFASLTGTVAAAGADPGVFLRSTRLLTEAPGGFKTLALVRISGGSPSVVAESGVALPAVLGASRTAALGKVAAAPTLTGGVASTLVFTGDNGKQRIGFAYSSPSLPGMAVYGESELAPQAGNSTTSGQPFEELYAAVYAGSRPATGQLIGVTGGGRTTLPLSGSTASASVKIGVGPDWLIVAKARHPLVGSVATQTPWFLLAAVLLAGGFAVVVVEALARRREYALAVADERTEELKASMTELASAQEQLVRSERLAAIGELASTIGHELRNPLGVLSNAVYLLRGDLGPEPDDAAARHLATAEREISAATVIVSDLLEFARQRDPVRTDVDVAALVDEVLSVLPAPRGVDVHRNIPAGSLIVPADRDMLRQVLLNLVSNAYQAMPEGGRLDVEVAADGKQVAVKVRDTGVGMTPEVSRRIFEPFYTTKARGVGLGLAVSRRMVEAHGGDVSVETAPGAGTTFAVALPRALVVALPTQSAPPADESVDAAVAEVGK